MRVGTFDLETNNLLPDVTTVWCAVVKDTKGNVAVFEPHNIDGLTEYLSLFDELRGHNSIAFDFMVLKKLYGWEYEGVKTDTLLMSRLQRPKRLGGHSVAAWGERLGHKKVEHEDWSRYSDDMLHRCSEDVAIQEEIYDEIVKEGEGEGWEIAHRLNHRMFHYLGLQEEHGWPVDEFLLSNNIKLLERYIRKIDVSVLPSLPTVVEIKETKKAGEYGYVKKPFKKDGNYSVATENFIEGLIDTAGFVTSPDIISSFIRSVVGGSFSRLDFRPVDLDKRNEVVPFLLDQGWQPEEWNYNKKTGEQTSPKMSHNDSFTGVAGRTGQIVARRTQCKARLGTMRGWVGAIRADGTIPAEVGGLAVTGRLRHKTIVNVPNPETGSFFAKQMRSVFITKPGWVIVGVDSKGNQIRQLAGYIQDEEFTNAVLHGNKEDGTDIHTVNQRKAGTTTRTLAKNFFYGLTFGAGDAKIGKIIGRNAQAGKKLKEEYFDALPGLKKLIEERTAEWRATAKQVYDIKYGRMEWRDGFIRGLDGRPIQVDSEHKILVSILQGDEAIQMSAAYIKFNADLEREGYTRGDDYDIYIWMHDEFQTGCKPEIKERVGQLAADSIAWAGNYFNIQCPHEGEINYGKSWADTH